MSVKNDMSDNIISKSSQQQHTLQHSNRRYVSGLTSRSLAPSIAPHTIKQKRTKINRLMLLGGCCKYTSCILAASKPLFVLLSTNNRHPSKYVHNELRTRGRAGLAGRRGRPLVDIAPRPPRSPLIMRVAATRRHLLLRCSSDRRSSARVVR